MQKTINFFDKIRGIYEDGIVIQDVKRKNAKIQQMKQFKNVDISRTLNEITVERFKNIIEEYPDVVVKFKPGQSFNLANIPWIQFYYLEKNSKGTKGNYCGLSIDLERNEISLWIGFGMTGLKKSEIETRKIELLKIYKDNYGEDLEKGFLYKTVLVNAIIISKKYNLEKLDDDELDEDLKYLLDLYIQVENQKLNQSLANSNNDFRKTELSYQKSPHILGTNIIYKGYPGSGKSYEIENKYLKDKNGNYIDDRCYERVVFYDEYTNADFIGTIRPVVKNRQPSYEFFPGPFSIILKRALENPETNFYLIIEEINRGNAESIFGDILLLLDRDTFGKSSYTITNSLIANYVYNDEFKKIYLPNNLSIIASMNVSDENVKTLDTAFERRWDTEWILGDTGIFDDMYIKGMNGLTWGKFRNVINTIIISQEGILHNEDKQLGAYFINDNFVANEINDNKKDREKFLYKVILYLYNKVCKYDKKLIFNDNVCSINVLIKAFLTNDYLSVFKEEVRKSL